MKHLLLLLVPDKQATLLAGALSLVAFLLGLLDMVDKDFESARFHLNLSVAIMGFLFILKFLSMRATFLVAEDAQAQLHQHLRKRKMRRSAPNPDKAAAMTEAEERAQERAEIAELTENLKQALNNIAPDSPVRPKYEATLELMQRFASKGA
jgi:hypothetical protein